jgi:hypothetical protein
MVLRLLMTGLCAACVVLVAGIQPFRIEVVQQTVVHERAPSPAVSVVDIAHTVAPHEVPALLRLGVDEQVKAINDRPVGDGLPGEALIGELALRAGQYLDLTVSNDITERRVLVLVH